jgi:hypothetical protein
MRRRLFFSACLGALTTPALAWCLALLPTSRQWSMTGLPLDPPPLAPATRLINIEQERGPGDEWAQVVVVVMQEGTLADGTRCLELAGAYESYGPVLKSEPPWRFDASTAPEVYRAIRAFPHPPWPRWLPPIPGSPRGLLSHGARATGWPLKSMRSVSRLDTLMGELQWSGALRVLPRTAYARSAARGPCVGSIPLFPIPLGFAADTALFASAWAVPLLLPGILRVRRRRRRGQCSRCGYDLRDGAHRRCPECGAPAAGLTSSGAACPSAGPPAAEAAGPASSLPR